MTKSVTLKPDEPERLWLSSETSDGHREVWFDPDEGGTLYVRADLVESPARPPKPDCEECHGTGEVFGHADDCHDDLCALNGDIHSCAGKVEPCGCTAPQSNTTVTEAAKRYLAAIDSDPENDIWDTWDGKPAEGALKTASDASWADHGQKIEARLSEMRAALAATEGQP